MGAVVARVQAFVQAVAVLQHAQLHTAEGAAKVGPQRAALRAALFTCQPHLRARPALPAYQGLALFPLFKCSSSVYRRGSCPHRITRGVCTMPGRTCPPARRRCLSGCALPQPASPATRQEQAQVGPCGG